MKPPSGCFDRNASHPRRWGLAAAALAVLVVYGALAPVPRIAEIGTSRWLDRFVANDLARVEVARTEDPIARWLVLGVTDPTRIVDGAVGDYEAAAASFLDGKGASHHEVLIGYRNGFATAEFAGLPPSLTENASAPPAELWGRSLRFYTASLVVVLAGLACLARLPRRTAGHRHPRYVRWLDPRRSIGVFAEAALLALGVSILVGHGLVWIFPNFGFSPAARIVHYAFYLGSPLLYVAARLSPGTESLRRYFGLRSEDLRTPHLWVAGLAGFSLTVVFDAFIDYLCEAIGLVDHSFLEVFDPTLLGSGVAGLIYGLTTACIFAPVAEEIVCRGFLQSSLCSRLGPLGGILATNAIFAAYHGYGLCGSAMVFSFGCVASWLRIRTGSLWPPVVAHSLTNALYVAALWVDYT